MSFSDRFREFHEIRLSPNPVPRTEKTKSPAAGMGFLPVQPPRSGAGFCGLLTLFPAPALNHMGRSDIGSLVF